MTFPDALSSAAVLIGIGGYSAPDLKPLPAVANNVRGLAEVLTAPPTGTFARDRCAVLSDPKTREEVAEKLLDAARVADDLLLVYYSGHGVLGGPNQDLFFPLENSNGDDVEWTGIPYSMVRNVLGRSKAKTRVLVLDCCYSGRVIPMMASNERRIIDQVDVSGVYVMTSAGRNAVAMAPEGEEYTAFTGVLLSVLRNGLPGSGEGVRLFELYDSVLQTMSVLGLPTPQQSAGNTAHNLFLVRNAALVIDSGVVKRPLDARRVEERIAAADEVGTGSSGDTRAALVVARSLLTDCVIEFGAEHRETLRVREQVARWTAAEDRQKGVDLAEVLARDCERIFGPLDPLTLKVRDRLASLLGWAGNHRRSVAIMDGVVEGRAKVLGPGDPGTLRSRESLAFGLVKIGEHAKAADAYDALIGAGTPEDADGARKVLRWRTQRACCRAELGDASAPAELADVVGAYDLRIGSDDPESMYAAEMHARWLSRFGRGEESLAVRQRVLDTMARVYGPSDQETLVTAHNLACTLGDLGRTREALEMFSSVLRSREAAFGRSHTDTLGTRQELAHCLIEAGQLREASEVLEELIDLRTAKLGREHPDTADALRALAHCRGRMGHPSVATQLYEELIKITTSLLGARSPQLLSDRSALAGQVMRCEKYGRAAEIYADLIDDLAFVQGDEDPATLQMRCAHADAVGYAGDPLRARELYSRILTDVRRSLGEAHQLTLHAVSRHVYWVHRPLPGYGFLPG
ncbi:tetratricopeptide repeat protein [Amycolatopsis sp. cg9]|uniref:caspase, EACC1-associated type n=1 Tax=Amycolatopsis sp. cg9 TaxID=3238801 RepID=UPI0035231281